MTAPQTNSLQLLKKKLKLGKIQKFLIKIILDPLLQLKKELKCQKVIMLKLVGGDDILHPNCTNFTFKYNKKK